MPHASWVQTPCLDVGVPSVDALQSFIGQTTRNKKPTRSKVSKSSRGCSGGLECSDQMPSGMCTRRSLVFQHVCDHCLWKVEHIFDLYGQTERHDTKHVGVSRWTQHRQEFHVDQHVHLHDSLCQHFVKVRKTQWGGDRGWCATALGIAVLVLSLGQLLFWRLGRVPEASCPGNGANPSVPGSRSGISFTTNVSAHKPCWAWLPSDLLMPSKV